MSNEVGGLDAERLSAWMDREGLPGHGETAVLDQVSGGASNELFAVTRGGVRMALRKPPADLAEKRNDVMRREVRILQALAGTDVPHAHAYGVCDDPEVAGTWFYMTEFVDGWSPVIETWPDPFLSDGAARHEMAFELVEGIARLSKVDWKTKDLEGLGKPDDFHERQVDRWEAQLETYKFREIPGLDDAAAWLRTHKPSMYEPGIMHGDYQFANVMFRHGRPTTLAAIIDWEMATIGDPLVDLGWILMSWPNANEDRTKRGRTDFNGMPDREDLMEAYARTSGRSVAEIDYYIILACFKQAVVLEGGYSRFVAGKSRNPMHEYFGPIVLRQALKAAEMTRTTSL